MSRIEQIKAEQKKLADELESEMLKDFGLLVIWTNKIDYGLNHHPFKLAITI